MKPKKVIILDYGIGNVKSILNALMALGEQPVITRNPEEFKNSDAMILPGVGAFGKGMENLASYELVPHIMDYIGTGKPFLGICLGMQMLFEESNEFGNHKGLGLIPGKVQRLIPSERKTDKIPNVCWDEILEPSPGFWSHTILKDLGENPAMYFVHTYAGIPERNEDILSLTPFGDGFFCSSVFRKNVMGVQFHPEKSGETGLKILKNFCHLT